MATTPDALGAVAGGGALAGRVAFVAGATGTIGRAVAAELAALGATVVVHCRGDRSGAEALAGALPGEHPVVQADLGDAGALEGAFAEVESLVGPVTVLVNTVHAGQGPVRVADATPGIIDAEFAGVKLHAALVARVVPGMRDEGWGRVVYLSGALMSRPHPGFGIYGAAKAAATTLTRYLALEEGRNGITANVVAPGRVVDPAEQVELDATRQELSDRLLERTALGVFPSPLEVAQVVSMLVGPGSGSITGQTMWVTGGEPIGS
ncbi:SDR family oxidoreductase [Herbiconiux ginsengi]|uniref:3-oxoacyl-[acyl-carrier protein] reductase n=1 Tax=Herbiconiux ginsengi TaxID=381665 RepID=A0A1H3KXS0_9MICO|nr:SDR family oxidoreductase [Herbiconiux ginsengi]SDY56445.1 3-oxoacyl-[acyl-carrier protein] reductase [Herbiconiux ginsengi]